MLNEYGAEDLIQMKRAGSRSLVLLTLQVHFQSWSQVVGIRKPGALWIFVQ
jgi:hypothetical protein